MADNVAITAGSGTAIATDEVTGTLEHVQLFKLAISADGSRTLVPADSTNGIDVDVTRVQGQVTVGDGTNAIAVDAAPGDAEANTVNLLYTQARGYAYNGTTWDRLRGDTANGLDVDVTRLPALAAGTNNIGNVGVTDGTNNLVVDTVHGDGESNTENHIDVAAKAMLFNGTSWDRMRGNTSNGLLVDVSRVQGQVTIGDGTNAVSVDAASTDAESNSVNQLHTQSRLFEFNGTTWDRKRSHATVFKAGQYTSAQTGTALWTPASGKAVVVTSLQIQSYGTTAGTAIIWFGGAADTTYTRSTDAAIFDGEFAPSATNKPGVIMSFPTPIRGTADFVLRVTTTNAQSITITVWGYEI